MPTTIQAKKSNNGKVTIAPSQTQLSNQQGTQATASASFTFPLKGAREFANRGELTAYMRKRGASQAEINTAIANFGL